MTATLGELYRYYIVNRVSRLGRRVVENNIVCCLKKRLHQLSKAQGIRTKLGGSGSLAASFPAKPKGVHEK